MPARRTLLVAAVGLFWAVATVASAADGSVEGMVTLRGKPLAGKLTLHWDEQFVGAKLNQVGRYKIDRVLVGKYKVTISGKDVPPMYASDDATSLVVEVKEGANEFDFDLP
jgi:hypothetical protein